MTRKDRFTRSRAKQAQDYRITPGDLAILKLLARYRYLRSSMIYRLISHRQERAIRYNLHKLFHHGYIDKPKEQLRGYNSLHCPDIYALDAKGRRRLLEDVSEVTNLTRKRSDAPVKNFAHAMMICDTLASIEIGAKASDCEFISQSDILKRCAYPNPMKLPCTIRFTFGTGRVERLETSIVPDGLFGLRYPNGKASFFALEAEHYNPLKPNTLKRASFLKKILAYRDIAKTGIFRKQLNIPNLRVLVVFPTITRAEHGMELVEEVVGQSNLFLLNTVPVQEELWAAPEPFPEVLEDKWMRGGMDGVAIGGN